MNNQKNANVTETNPQAALMTMLNGAWEARLVHTAAELHLADYLAGEPQDAASLALLTNTHPPTLARLLRTLTAIGILRESADRHYSLTPLGMTLRSDAPGSMRAWALLCFSDDQGTAWQALTHAVRTGDHAFRHVFGADQWTRLAARPDAARLFDEAMQSLTQGVNGALVTHYPFENYKWLVDVGGGNGALLLPVVARNPSTRLTVFDLPHVAEAARQKAVAAGSASDRVEFVGGDVFTSVPAGADAYVLKSVIHDWDDKEAIEILRSVRAAMPDGSKLLLIERILPDEIDPNDPVTRAKFIHDINMFINPGGRERSEIEFRELLKRAGLNLERVVIMPSPQAVMECVKNS